MRGSEPVIDPELIRQHGLTEEEYERIRSLLGREPTYTELGMFSLMWSEHCSYKSSKVHLRKLPGQGPRVIYGPGENAGVVDIGDGLALVFKMESHNHPSFIEPYQGAATGVGGIIRDIFTMGARPIALLDSLRFGDADAPKTRYLLRRVVEGIASYGNCMGIPTVGGEIYFHPCYDGNNLVNVFCLGVAPIDRIFRARAAGDGNPVIYVGARTGRDGIHGATMASEEFDETSEERRPTVQVGDPFTEKLLLEACLELMAGDAIVGIQDMGAAGLTCSTLEMAERGECGMQIDLAAVPLREEGMAPYEVMLSESQERMLLVAERGREEEVRKVFQRWGLQASVIGRVTDDGLVRVTLSGKEVARIPVRGIISEAPLYDRPQDKPPNMRSVCAVDEDELPCPSDLSAVLIDLLTGVNLCSRESVFEQYDHMVQVNTIVYPGSDAAVLRIKGTEKAVALAADCNSTYCHLNPYEGAVAAVAECARNLVCSGARPLALTDCLNFGNPENPEIMWQFARSVEGIRDACGVLKIPVVSGNVSFYNETQGVPIHPTPTIAMVGLLDNWRRQSTQWFKLSGDCVAVLGPIAGVLDGSQYLLQHHELEVGQPKPVDLYLERDVQRACVEANEAGLLHSAHDCAEGGLAVALAECAITRPEGPLGVRVQFDEVVRPDTLLFGEAPSRIIVTLAREDLDQLCTLAANHGVSCKAIGEVGGDTLHVEVSGNPKMTLDVDLVDLRERWKGTLARYLAPR